MRVVEVFGSRYYSHAVLPGATEAGIVVANSGQICTMLPVAGWLPPAAFE